jgi:hypothetical protein
MFLEKALKGLDILAQGVALGTIPKPPLALKGRKKSILYLNNYHALTGLLLLECF